jgi:phosphomevalonate kinase
VIVSRAPGKLVALGEYAVLDGAPAVVLAIDRYVEARLSPSPDPTCRLETRAAESTEVRFPPGAPSGVDLVDRVAAAVGPSPAWLASIDSTALYSNGAKLGLGSSAAVLCAWAGAYAAFARANGRGVPEWTLPRLIELHRAFQGGRGSGIDVAASLLGGAVSFRLGPAGVPQVGSVRVPNGVGFASIFTGRSASTPEFLARYRAWQRERPAESAALLGRLRGLAEAGVAALTGHDAVAWLDAFAGYGRGLEELGTAIGAEIVTTEHRRIGEEAVRFGVAYKVSGAGGGDLGLACAADFGALAAFTKSVGDRGFRVINVSLAEHGLVVQQQSSGDRA